MEGWWSGGVAAPPIELLTLLPRLGLSLVFGWLVAWIYRRTRTSPGETVSLPITLVLLCILIAMVTQVIGDSVARAFSLVGALSIVRFRTVVQDTRDTAFVIFAVVVGMAVGASSWAVALSGIVVVGAAAYLFKPTTTVLPRVDQSAELRIRLALGRDPHAVTAALQPFAQEIELRSVQTARRGTAINYIYSVKLKSGADPAAVVQQVHCLDGVQGVQFKRP